MLMGILLSRIAWVFLYEGTQGRDVMGASCPL